MHQFYGILPIFPKRQNRNGKNPVHKTVKCEGIWSLQWAAVLDQMAQLLALQARTPLVIFRKCQGFFSLPPLYFLQRMTQGLRLLW